MKGRGSGSDKMTEYIEKFSGPCSYHITMLDTTSTFILKWESEVESLQLQMHPLVIVRIPRHSCCVECRIRGKGSS